MRRTARACAAPLPAAAAAAAAAAHAARPPPRSFTLVHLHGERSSWVSLPPALAARLAGAPLPLLLALRVAPPAPGLPPGPPAFVAWGGASCGPGCVGVPAPLAAALGLADGARVALEPRPDLPDAAQVELEPASPDDWEVVELNAGLLEEQLLAQAGAAAVGQVLPVWVRGQPVLLRAAATVPDAPAVRLVPGAEVLVAPRPRGGGRRGSLDGGGGAVAAAAPRAASPPRAALRLRRLPSGELAARAAAAGAAAPPGALLAFATADALRRAGLAHGDVARLEGPVRRHTFACVAEAAGAAPGHLEGGDALLAALRSTEFEPVRARRVADDARAAALEESCRAAAAPAHLFVKPAPPPAAAAALPAAEVGDLAPPARAAFLRALERLLPVLGAGPRGALQAWGAPRPGGVLLAGAPGSGKSALVGALAAALAAHPDCLPALEVVRCREVGGGDEGGDAVRAALAPRFAAALARAPALIVLEDLDVLLPAGGGDPGPGGAAPPAADAAALRWLCDALDSLLAPAPEWRAAPDAPAAGAWPPVMVLATARAPAALPKALRAPGRLDWAVELPPPGAAARAAMLAAGARARGAAVDPAALVAAAAAAEGFAGADVDALLDRALGRAAARALAAPGAPPRRGAPPPRLAAADLAAAAEGLVPAALWGSGARDALVDGVEGWADVGGLADVRAALREAVELPARFAAAAARAPLRLRTGALLFGPPGCGKSRAVAAAVAAAGLRCVAVSGPELLNKYIGASEAAVRDVFRRAAAAAPCVLFFDEFDALAPRRGADNTGVSDRVVNQLLTELDGVEALVGVAVVAATSRPDLLDPALLRPGRLDRALHCGFPTPPERAAILAALARRLRLADDADLGAVAASAEGFSGADLGAVLADAQLAAAHEALEAREAAAPLEPGGPAVAARHLAAALAAARPSVPAHERARLDALYAPFLPGGRRAAPADRGKAKVTFA